MSTCSLAVRFCSCELVDSESSTVTAAHSIMIFSVPLLWIHIHSAVFLGVLPPPIFMNSDWSVFSSFLGSLLTYCNCLSHPLLHFYQLFSVSLIAGLSWIMFIASTMLSACGEMKISWCFGTHCRYHIQCKWIWMFQWDPNRNLAGSSIWEVYQSDYHLSTHCLLPVLC